MTATTHCELRSVRKEYGGRAVLDGFDLAVGAGEMVAVTGASGSGKSTVLNLLGLLEAPDGGEVRLLGGRAPRPRSRGARRYLRGHLGYLFQNFALIEGATVRENLEVALAYAPGPGTERERTARALEHVGLAGTEERRVFSLSGGEQQRVAIARLMLKPCEIVLADEPTGSLDADNRDVVLGLLRGLNGAGRTVVVATHDRAVVDACSREVALDRTGI
ncbi:ATP-binding cassette domain-containing protein [Nocardiopsis flavescens]|uniref:ATP-binding cassette domain-containing protein n=1 Tax=Nocardiopsis flavescens TaxID=758803 RepID=UPI00364AD39A